MPRKELVVSKQKQTYSPAISIVDSLKQGLGFGIGSSIARSFFSSTTEILPAKNCDVFVDQLNKCKEEGFCSEEFISSIKESLQKCNRH